MAVDILHKQEGRNFVVRFTGSGVVYPNHAGALGANNRAGSVESMRIAGADFGSVSANACGYSVKRGANTVAFFGGNGVKEYLDGLFPDNAGGEPQSNVVVTKIGTGDCHLTLKFHKKETFVQR
jgi:hypothetical protein